MCKHVHHPGSIGFTVRIGDQFYRCTYDEKGNPQSGPAVSVTVKDIVVNEKANEVRVIDDTGHVLWRISGDVIPLWLLQNQDHQKYARTGV